MWEEINSKLRFAATTNLTNTIDVLKMECYQIWNTVYIGALLLVVTIDVQTVDRLAKSKKKKYDTIRTITFPNLKKYLDKKKYNTNFYFTHNAKSPKNHVEVSWRHFGWVVILSCTNKRFLKTRCTNGLMHFILSVDHPLFIILNCFIAFNITILITYVKVKMFHDVFVHKLQFWEKL